MSSDLDKLGVSMLDLPPDSTIGLSFSGMKDLAVSPYRYWYLHINPQRPERKETPEMKFGTALHCAVLEPDTFETKYCREIQAEDYPDCLVTADDLRAWLGSKGYKVTARNKRELIERVLTLDSTVVILDVLEAQQEITHAGKIRLKQDEWDRARGCTDALRSEPQFQAILEYGAPEVCMSAVHPDTGALLKARMDWVAPSFTLDVKTFSQSRGKSIDKTVTDAIFYERYYLQAYVYSLIRSLAEGNRSKSGAQTAPEYVIAFVESDPPHEVRLRSLRPKYANNANVYWQRAMLECRDLIRVYAACFERYGERPWRSDQAINLLADDEIPQLAYA
jgi:hypothetical protein